MLRFFNFNAAAIKSRLAVVSCLTVLQHSANNITLSLHFEAF